MAHKKLPPSSVEPMLVDPGKFYVNVLRTLYYLDYPVEELESLVVEMVSSLLDSCCSSEDVPRDFKKFIDDIDKYANKLIDNNGNDI